MEQEPKSKDVKTTIIVVVALTAIAAIFIYYQVAVKSTQRDLQGTVEQGKQLEQKLDKAIEEY